MKEIKLSFMKNKSRLKVPTRESEELLKKALCEFHSDEDTKTFLKALGKVAKSVGSINLIAKKAGIDRRSLYRFFSGNVVPSLRIAIKVFKALGFELNVNVVHKGVATELSQE